MIHKGRRHWHVYYRTTGTEWTLYSRHKTQEAAQEACANSAPWLGWSEWRIEYWDGNDALEEDARRAADWREDRQCQTFPL